MHESGIGNEQVARRPRAISNTIGTMAKSTSCLSSMKLVRGSNEKADDIRVIAA